MWLQTYLSDSVGAITLWSQEQRAWKVGIMPAIYFLIYLTAPGLAVLCVSCSVMSNSLQSQVSLSMAFPRQEYWSRLPFPPPGDLPDPGTHPSLLNCRWILFFFFAGGFFTVWATRERWVSVSKFWIFRCSMWDLVPWPEIGPRPSALGLQCLSH